MTGFQSCYKTDKKINVKSLHNNNLVYGFGGRCLDFRDVCMDFEPRLKVHNLVSVYPKASKLLKMTTLNVVFDVVVPSQFPAQFLNGLLPVAA